MRVNRYNELLNLVKSLEKDFDKFYEKNNHAAGTRLRHAMQDVKDLAQEVRVSIQETKKYFNDLEKAQKAKSK